jgi:hypothetical protein
MSEAPRLPPIPAAPPEPLIPRTAVSGATVGGIGAGLVASIGWLATEIVSLERQVALATERVAATSQDYNRRLTATEEAIQTLRERMATFERAVLDRREQRP